MQILKLCARFGNQNAFLWSTSKLLFMIDLFTFDSLSQKLYSIEDFFIRGQSLGSKVGIEKLTEPVEIFFFNLVILLL